MSTLDSPKNGQPELLRVFLCHATEDKPAVRALYQRLKNAGVSAWLDEEDLLPGQDWRLEISRAIRTSHAFIVCLSGTSTTKEGFVHKEIRSALDMADEKPEDAIFVIPVRLEHCKVPERLSRWHYVDLFDERGVSRLLKALQHRANELEIAISPTATEVSAVAGHRDSGQSPIINRQTGAAIIALEDSAQRERVHENDGTVLVYVPGGKFTLGADAVDEDSRPIHQVVLSPFWIAKYPVTNEQYRRYLKANPNQPKPELWDDKEFNQPQQPVVGVSWEEAVAYCRWAGLELPSEAQWEAAARGQDQRHFPWGNDEPTESLANFGGTEGKTTPVGGYPGGAGPYGTLDQSGNVWEWCADVWDGRAYKGREGQLDPVATTGDAAVRVLRGGSWAFPPWHLAAAYRFWYGAGYRLGDIGFRGVLRVGPEH